MPLSQLNLELLNHHAQRSYPITSDSTKRDITGSFTIPDDFLVGLGLAVSPAMDMESGRFFIRQIGVNPSGVHLIISSDTGSGLVDVGTVMIPDTGTIRNRTVGIGGIEPFDDLKGNVTVGKLSTIREQPSGLFNFTLADTRIEPAAIQPMIRGISSMSVAVSSGSSSERLYGDIELVAGSNIQLSTVSTATETKIVISALDGEGTIADCICEGEAAYAPCIQTINGIRPGTDGNFNFIGDDCIDFTGIASGLKVTDACCTPCCGCEELETITRDLERFNAQRESLTLFINQLAAETATFGTTVLGSKLSDRKCLTCE